MHRIDYDPTTRNKHGELQIQLGRVLGDLQATLVAGEKPNGVLIVSVIEAISRWRPELERCNGLKIKFLDELLTFIPEFNPLHADLISWLNELSITLKLQLAGVEDPAGPIVDASRIEQGQRMIDALSCRERLVWR